MTTHSASDDAIDISRSLAPLGFTDTEALVYAELVRRPGQTGYSLSKVIGKGQPSIYAALASLELKGAVVGQDGSARLFTATPPSELLDRLEQRFAEQRARAERAFAHLQAGPRSAAVQELTTEQQVFAKARALIDSARETILFEMFPAPLETLRADLARAERRKGLRMAGLVMRAAGPIGGARLVVSPVGERILELWPPQILHVVVDGRSALLAGLRSDGAAEALWTDNVFLSTILHNALTSDVLLHNQAPSDWTGPNRELFGGHPPGLRDIINQA